jgi:hypothetical protein
LEDPDRKESSNRQATLRSHSRSHLRPRGGKLLTNADGTPVTVYVDEDFNVVTVESRGAGGRPQGTA